MGILKTFTTLNKTISSGFDRLLGHDFDLYGTAEFDTKIMPAYLQNGQSVFDVGGGKNPNIDAAVKAAKNLHVIGIDIAETELKIAPDGLYDVIYVRDIAQTPIENIGEKADVIICRALMEHVPDTEAALRNMAAMLKPGGYMLMFVPCRNALYTRINMLLPEAFKVKLLRLTFPNKMHRLGFKAYYDRTTPGEFEAMARALDLDVIESHAYWASCYFKILFPVHILWRLYQAVLRLLSLQNYCETFVMVLRKA